MAGIVLGERMHTPRSWRIGLCLASVGWAVGCGAAEAGRDYWVYFGTFTGAKSEGIYVSRMDAYGNLSEPELAAASPIPAFLAVDRQHRFLYAANETSDFGGKRSGSVSAFALDARTGRLTPLNQVSAITPGPTHITVDATGRTVLIANYAGSSVAAFPVKADGRLGEASSFIPQHGSSVNPARQKEPHAHCVVVDAGNRFAFVCDLGLDQVLVFKLDPVTATLTPNEPPFAKVAPGAGPRHLAFSPDGRFAYVINEMACTVTAFAYDAAHGTLAEIQTISTLPASETVRPEYSTAEVCVHPSGRFLYGSNRGHNSIVVYAIDGPTGKLSLVEHVPSGGRTPRNFNLDPAGRYLISANQDSGSVLVYQIDEPTGRLTPTGTKIEIDKPVCVVFVPAE